MKRFLSIFILCASILMAFPATTFADNNSSKTIPMKKEKRREHEPILDPVGRRTPPAPTVCTISHEGIMVAGIDNSQIDLYEAYDADGICILSSPSEADFISFIYSVTEEIELRIYSESYVFSGWWNP